MPVQIAGNTSANIAEVESNTKALRAVIRPDDFGSLGIYRLAAASGVMTAGLAGGSPVWSFRWGNGSNLGIVKRVVVSAGNTATAFAAGVVTFQLFRALSFSASDTGGTDITPTSNQNKLRTSMGTTLLTSARISSTATLTAGTRTLDTNPIGSITVGVPATAGSIVLSPTPILDQRVGEYPLVLAQNEGLVLQATVPGTGTWTFSVSVDWEELAAY